MFFAAPLRDVSSIGLAYNSNYILLIFGVLFLAAYGLGLLLILAYFMTKQRYIVVNIQDFPMLSRCAGSPIKSSMSSSKPLFKT